ncbi:MAG: DUF4870 domain-containing protein [Phycisphaerae bacterium]|nr:DUF4870 domain-containing protein [Phycisphaerae bacterium]
MKVFSFVHIVGALSMGVVPFVIWIHTKKKDSMLVSQAFDSLIWNVCLVAIWIPCGIICATVFIGSELFFPGKISAVALVLSQVLQVILFVGNLLFSFRAISRIRSGRGRPYPLPPTRLYESLRERAGLSVMARENETVQ